MTDKQDALGEAINLLTSMDYEALGMEGKLVTDAARTYHRLKPLMEEMVGIDMTLKVKDYIGEYERIALKIQEIMQEEV